MKKIVETLLICAPFVISISCNNSKLKVATDEDSVFVESTYNDSEQSSKRTQEEAIKSIEN